MNETELLESKELRERLKDRVEVLNKVKGLFLLPDTELATTEQVARYYEVEKKTIQKLVERNRDELNEDGLKAMTYHEVKEMVNTDNMSALKIPPKGTLIFTLRAILRVGMLLRDSKIAKEIRTQLLNTFENSTDDAKHKAIDDEKDLIFKVVTAPDETSRMVALGEYHKYMNKYKEFVERVVDAPTGITMTKIAKEFGLKSATQLNKILSEKKIQYKDKQGQWLLYSEYADKGYTAPYTYVGDDGNTHHSTNWTEKGKQFIYELLKDECIRV